MSAIIQTAFGPAHHGALVALSPSMQVLLGPRNDLHGMQDILRNWNRDANDCADSRPYCTAGLSPHVSSL